MSFSSRIRTLRDLLFRRDAVERDLDEEVRSYFELRKDRAHFGGPAQVKQQVREARMGAAIENTVRDLKYAIRALRKNPGFTVVAVLTLALGIGANTAIFSLINAVMLTALPVSHPEQLVLLTDPGSSGVAWETKEKGVRNILAYPEFEALRAAQPPAQPKAFSGMFAAQSAPIRVDTFFGDAAHPTPARVQLVSGEFFEVLGVHPIAGRVFTPTEDKTLGANPVAVVSHAFWLRELAADPTALGKDIHFGQGIFRIIGIAPPGFRGMEVGAESDVWIPITMQRQAFPGRDYLTPRDTLWLQVMARLAPGVRIETAQAAVNVTFRQILQVWAAAEPTEKDRKQMLDQRLEVHPGATGTSGVRDQFSEPLLLLMGMVGLVLLIACANIANLMLARATARQREIGVRLALGAARIRLIRQLMVESVLVSAIGGAFGLAVAAGGARLLLALVSSGVADLSLNTPVDGRVLLFTAGASVLTGILFGLAPAVRATHITLNETLCASSRGSVGGRGRVGAGKLLVVGQVAISVILLLGASLFARSLRNMTAGQVGFDRDRLLQAVVDPVTAGYKGAATLSFYDKILREIRANPQISGVTLANQMLFSGSDSGDRISLDGSPVHDPEQLRSNWTLVGPDYFHTLGITLLQGRDISRSDAERRTQVCVVNQDFAKKFFPGGSPLGRHLTDEYPTTRETFEIIGVSANAKEHRPDEKEEPRFYATLFHPIGTVESITVLAGSNGDPSKLGPIVRAAIARVDANAPVTRMRTVDEQLGRRLLVQRLIAELSGFFGIAGLLMAAIGLYGVISYSMSLRTSEIGIRMALGASGAGVVRMVLRETLWLVGWGVAIGLPCALAASRVIASRLFGLTPSDPLSISFAVGVVLGAALLSAWIPARRAALTDPMQALRTE